MHMQRPASELSQPPHGLGRPPANIVGPQCMVLHMTQRCRKGWRAIVCSTGLYSAARHAVSQDLAAVHESHRVRPPVRCEERSWQAITCTGIRLYEFLSVAKPGLPQPFSWLHAVDTIVVHHTLVACPAMPGASHDRVCIP